MLTHISIKIAIFFKWLQLGYVKCFFVVLNYLNIFVAITALENVGLY